METVHFRIGADMGIILMNIAHEHLIYENDLKKAKRAFTESFGGDCPEDLLKALITGEMIILVDEEDQMFRVVPRGEFPHLDHLYPKLDLVEFLEKKETELQRLTESFDTGLDFIINELRYKSRYATDFSVDAVVKYLYGNDKDMIAEIHDDFELNSMATTIALTRDFIEKSLKLQEMFKEIGKWYGLKNYELDTYELLNLVQKVQQIAKAEFHIFPEANNDTLRAYVEASQKIQKTLDTGIEPVDIMQNWSAGWLSPEGEYYALNGEIGNMLHIQIADALQEKGIVSEKDKHDMAENPDSWLEQQGWVKIHGNNVQFAGNLNPNLDLPIVHLTDKQIDIIRDYIINCHACEIKAGWRLERTSIEMFTAMAKRDKIALYKKYFDY
jgi:hypothetical protein